MNKVRITDRMVDAINYICNDEPNPKLEWIYDQMQHGEDYNRWRYSRWSTMIRRPMKSTYSCNWQEYKKGVAKELRRQRLNSIILKQNAQLRKDGYTGPFLGACLLAPPPKN